MGPRFGNLSYYMNNSPREFFALVWRLFHIAGVRKRLLAYSCLLISAASLFQLAGLGLVVPVLNGLVDESHFEGIRNAAGIGFVLSHMPFELSNQNVFIFMMFLIVTSVYLENLCLYFGRIISAKVATNFEHKLRAGIFSRFLGFSKAFYDKQNIGELNTIMTSVVSATGLVMQQITNVVILLAFSAGFLVLMLLISWKLTIFAALLLPIAHFVSRGVTARIRSSADAELDRLVDLSDHSLDVLSTMPLASLLGTEIRERKLIERQSLSISEHSYAVRRRRFLIPCLVDIVNSTGVILVVCASVFLFFSLQSYSLGRLLVFFVCLRRFASHLQQLASCWSHCVASVPNLQKLSWVFEDTDKTFVRDGSRKFQGLSKEISFDGVCFSYDGENETLKDISFRVPVGSMVALVGASGAGKTSIVNLLPRFYDYQSGSIKIDGVDLKEFELSSLRSKIGVVSQSTMLINDSIRNNIVYGLPEGTVNESSFKKSVKAAQLEEFIGSLPDGLNTIIGAKGVRLSGGERQRISIARAILRDPEILILDEATSALDAETEQNLKKAIENLVAERTVLVVAHRLSTIKNADNVLVVENGEIVEQGKPAVLIGDEGRFHEFWKIQNLSQ